MGQLPKFNTENEDLLKCVLHNCSVLQTILFTVLRHLKESLVKPQSYLDFAEKNGAAAATVPLKNNGIKTG